MQNEAFYLQQMMENYKSRAGTLVVTSGKGGVGKTSIAVNLAVCMAASNKKVLLFDADMSLGNVDILMDLNSRYNVSHLLSGRRSIEEITCTGPAGLEVICGASGLAELADIGDFQRERLLSELSRLQTENDMIVIDTAAGISKAVAGFCLSADHVLVVATPEAAAITDAYAMIKLLAKNAFAGRISVVVNMAETMAEGRNVYRQIANAATHFLGANVYGAGVLLRDERLTQAVRMRKPVVLAYPKSMIATSLLELAARLSNGMQAQPREQSFFRKVVDWFF
ncbi:MAG: MinD/ParA family protein [Phycisphaerales bacterium]|nr:MAG: MinD/ParA family protein [Phycisphaerales bacterium]